MSKITLEVDIKELIAGIPIKQRIELVQELEKETWAKRLDFVVNKIRKSVKKRPVSFRKVSQICEEVRRHNYEKSKHSS